MKKLFAFFVFFAGMSVIFPSCEKEMDDTKYVTIEAAVTSNSNYQLDLSQYGDEDDVATITTQASNFVVSEIQNTIGRFKPVYHYSTSAKTTTTDQVVITITEGKKDGRNGRGHCDKDDATIVTIKFTIN